MAKGSPFTVDLGARQRSFGPTYSRLIFPACTFGLASTPSSLSLPTISSLLFHPSFSSTLRERPFLPQDQHTAHIHRVLSTESRSSLRGVHSFSPLSTLTTHHVAMMTWRVDELLHLPRISSRLRVLCLSIADYNLRATLPVTALRYGSTPLLLRDSGQPPAGPRMRIIA